MVILFILKCTVQWLGFEKLLKFTKISEEGPTFVWLLVTLVCTLLLMWPMSEHRKPPGEVGMGADRPMVAFQIPSDTHPF